MLTKFERWRRVECTLADTVAVIPGSIGSMPKRDAVEIKASADWLQQFEPEPWAFAYPYGGLSEDSPHLLKEHGFMAAFTTQTQLHHSDPYFIGRLDGEEMAQDGLIYD